MASPSPSGRRPPGPAEPASNWPHTTTPPEPPPTAAISARPHLQHLQHDDWRVHSPSDSAGASLDMADHMFAACGSGGIFQSQSSPIQHCSRSGLDRASPRRSARLRAQQHSSFQQSAVQQLPTRACASANLMTASRNPAARGAGSASGAAGGVSSSSDIRRNLFHAQASRRPPSSAASSVQSAGGAGGAGGGGATAVFGADDSDDIVVRDKNGECAVAIPVLPAPDPEQAVEEEAKSAETRLQDLLANRPRQQASDQEILEALHTSLQNTVDSLSQDVWQFSRGI